MFQNRGQNYYSMVEPDHNIEITALNARIIRTRLKVTVGKISHHEHHSENFHIQGCLENKCLKLKRDSSNNWSQTLFVLNI